MENIEIELKFEIRFEEISSYISKLENLGFKNIGRVHEMNVMYDNGKQLMQATDGRIRLRKSGDDTRLTYKKPLSRKGVKKEIEYEISVSDFDKTEKILEMMEFKRTTSYERYRTYLDNHNIEVMIDEFPFATFIEIEGEETKIKVIASKLGFSMKDNLTGSCDTIYTKRCISQGISPSLHILFGKCNIPNLVL